MFKTEVDSEVHDSGETRYTGSIKFGDRVVYRGPSSTDVGKAMALAEDEFATKLRVVLDATS